MFLQQVSIFLENKKGRLAEATNIIYKAGINIRTLCLADSQDFGVLRLIVNDPDKCVKVLKENNIFAQTTDIFAIEIEDRPGGLFKILDIFDKNGINIEYSYAFVDKSKDNAVVIFKITEKEKALDVLKKNKVTLIYQSDIAI